MVSNNQWLLTGKHVELCLTFLKITIFTGKHVELAEALIRRNIKNLCIHETKWIGEKAKPIGEWGYKLLELLN